MTGNSWRSWMVLGLLGFMTGCGASRDGAGEVSGSKGQLSGELAVVRGSRLFLMKPDGSAEREVALNVAEDLAIEWSRDGRWIVYPGAAQGGAADLWGVKIDAKRKPSEPINLTHLEGGVARSAAISLDSKYLAFMRDQPAGLYVVAVGGKEPARRLTHDGQLDQIPTWSADGKSLVYGELVFTDESAVEKFRMQLFIARFDPQATGVAPATPIPAGDGPSDSPALLPVRSESAYTLAFRAHRKGNDEIALLDPVHLAAQEINLTKSTADEHDPVWSPDGKRLVFWRRTKTSQELWTIRPDGKEAVRVCTITADPAPGAVEWSPDARMLAFSFARAKDGVWMVEASGGRPRKICDGNQVKWR